MSEENKFIKIKELSKLEKIAQMAWELYINNKKEIDDEVLKHFKMNQNMPDYHTSSFDIAWDKAESFLEAIEYKLAAKLN